MTASARRRPRGWRSGGFDGATPMAMADMPCRGDITVIEDMAASKGAGGRGLARAAVLGTPLEERERRAVYPVNVPEVDPGATRGGYALDQIGRAWECQRQPMPRDGRSRPASGRQDAIRLYPPGVCYGALRTATGGTERNANDPHARPKISVREALRRDGAGDVRRDVRDRWRAAWNRRGARHRSGCGCGDDAPGVVPRRDGLLDDRPDGLVDAAARPLAARDPRLWRSR